MSINAISLSIPFGLEPLEEFLHAILAEPLLEDPDRVLVRHVGGDVKAKETLEAESVEDLELGLLLAQSTVSFNLSRAVVRCFNSSTRS